MINAPLQDRTCQTKPNLTSVCVHIIPKYIQPSECSHIPSIAIADNTLIPQLALTEIRHARTKKRVDNKWK